MAKRRKQRHLARVRDHFGKWQRIDLMRADRALKLEDAGLKPSMVWRNDLYQVLVYRDYVKVPNWPTMHWLSIKRLDKKVVHVWRDLQRIKNELLGAIFDAVERYPPEDALIDTTNQYHLWVLADPKLRFPFGFTMRSVCKPHDDGCGGSKQEPWPEGQEPRDAMDAAEFNALCDDIMGPGDAGSPDMPGYRDRDEPCDLCGAVMDPHICGIGKKNGEVIRFPLYTGGTLQDVSDVGGPHPIEEGDQ